jgi:hypothetical protein
LKGERLNMAETVFGALIQFVSLRKINTIDIEQTLKIIYRLSVIYTIKKHLKLISKKIKSDLVELGHLIIFKTDQIASETYILD